MYLVGLTGGIATGKSTVSTILKGYGADIIDADVLAHQIIEPGRPVWQAIVERFGNELLLPDQRIDRDRLGEMVFQDAAIRSWLESLTHPAIEREIKEQVSRAARNGVKIIVLDVPLLLEVGWHEAVDEVWLVYVTEEIQLDRLMKRNGYTYEQAVTRIKAQMSLDTKKEYAQVLIDNGSTLEQTTRQVDEAWNQAIARSHL